MCWCAIKKLLTHSLIDHFVKWLRQALQKGKPFWILLEQEMMGWHCHQLDYMHIICTSLQTDNHARTSPLSFYRLDALPDAQPTALRAITKGDKRWLNIISFVIADLLPVLYPPICLCVCFWIILEWYFSHVCNRRHHCIYPRRHGRKQELSRTGLLSGQLSDQRTLWE